MIHPRIAVAALSFSALGFAGLVADEYFTSEAVIPTKNDRPTVCFGMTYRPDGSPVKLGDKCSPVEGVQRSIKHIAKGEIGLKRCVVSPMSQAEYDILVDFAYQYGVPTACTSSIVMHTNAGRYRDACNAYTLYKRSGGYDCSTLINGKPNKRCWGVWARSMERRDKCLAAQ